MEYNTRQLKKMEKLLLVYQDGSVSFGLFVNNLLALYDAIDEVYKTKLFVDSFHDIWDVLEEFNAVNYEEEGKEKILYELLPKFNAFINDVLNTLNRSKYLVNEAED